MGWIVRAECAGCGLTQPDLRLGGSHAEIAQHDVCHSDLYRAACCGRVQAVQIFMGQPLPDAPCEACSAPLTLDASTRYRIATLSGEQLDGHACPRCDAPALAFVRTDSFGV